MRLLARGHTATNIDEIFKMAAEKINNKTEALRTYYKYFEVEILRKRLFFNYKYHPRDVVSRKAIRNAYKISVNRKTHKAIVSKV